MSKANLGLLFDIQRFSIHDGPGIRTTLFFKGCSLRCAWCHNPESFLAKQQLSYRANSCQLCGSCIKAVRGEGIAINGNKLDINFTKHDQNFSLVDLCPHNAYSCCGQEYNASELVELCLKDLDYYQESSGGITFSGGEALNQINFLLELGLSLKELGLHICLDTAGFAPISSYQKSLEFTDIYLLDYKLTNKADYLPYLGLEFDIERVLAFLEEKSKSVILRCPLIPNVNNNLEHFNAIASLSQKYRVIERIDILPYHNLSKQGQFLGSSLGQKFIIADQYEKNCWKKMIKECGIRQVYLDGKLVLL